MSFPPGSSAFNLEHKLTEKFWALEVPVLSTVHISESTNGVLSSQGDEIPWAHCASYEFGYFISVPTLEDFQSHLPPAPADLVNIWNWARERNYSWVRLDADGDSVEGLPIFDW